MAIEMNLRKSSKRKIDLIAQQNGSARNIPFYGDTLTKDNLAGEQNSHQRVPRKSSYENLMFTFSNRQIRICHNGVGNLLFYYSIALDEGRANSGHGQLSISSITFAAGFCHCVRDYMLHFIS